MRGPCTFRQNDIVRALRAMKSAGVEAARVEIERDGKIIIVTGKGQEAENPEPDVNEWDQ